MLKPYRLTTLALLFCATTTFASIENDLRTAIEPLIANTLPAAQIGITVMEAMSGQVLYDRQGFEVFTPASNAKLFSGAAALYQLGPDYRFKTQVAIKPKHLHDATYGGDLYWQFNGDPSFKKSHIAELVKKIKDKGIKKISGNIVIDNTRFKGPVYAPGWSVDDLNWYFSAPITSIIIDQNAVGVNLTPSKQLGKKAATSLADKSLKPFIKLNANVKTVTQKKAQYHCQLNVNVDNRNHISLSGCWPMSYKSKYMRIAVKNPRDFAERLIRAELKKQHISWHGKFKLGKRPKGAKVIATHESRPLKSLIYTLLKDSNNIYAESFTKTLGAEIGGAGTFQQGSNAIANILHKKANIDFTKLKLVDGSGGSRYNLISPRQITRLLYVIYNTNDINTLYRDALPLSGKNGTLKERMKSFDLTGNIYAKTGTLTGISTLSGYMKTHSGRNVVFSIMINHIVNQEADAKMLQSQIASALYQL